MIINKLEAIKGMFSRLWGCLFSNWDWDSETVYRSDFFYQAFYGCRQEQTFDREAIPGREIIITLYVRRARLLQTEQNAK